MGFISELFSGKTTKAKTPARTTKAPAKRPRTTLVEEWAAEANGYDMKRGASTTRVQREAAQQRLTNLLGATDAAKAISTARKAARRGR